MLRVSIHAGPPEGCNQFNQRAWLTISYDRLSPVADYNIVLFQYGVGATPTYSLTKYPRWSSSLWDLVARSIAIALNDSSSEAAPELETKDKQFAFMSELSAVIEHIPAGSYTRRSVLSTVSVRQPERKRGTYKAKFEEHTMKAVTTAPFEFKPAFLRPEELLLHACMHRLTGKAEMPPRPALCVPQPVIMDGEKYVPVHRLVEPARTGLVLWLAKYGEQPLAHEDAPQGLVPGDRYSLFLSEAV
jgi:hypothetical protein